MEWIKVDECLPEHGVEVWVFRRSLRPNYGVIRCDRRSRWPLENNSWTHWMPLPDPPA
jgi:hypothetical protein